MGYALFLTPKCRDHKTLTRIEECQEANGRYFLSRDFAMFQSRTYAFEGSELRQVETLLDIDLSNFIDYPSNYEPEVDGHEYDLYLAEEEGDVAKAEAIKKEIQEIKDAWDRDYDKVNDGWVKVTDLRETTHLLIKKMKANPSFGEYIVVAEGWDYAWEDYFTLKPKTELPLDARLMEDLEKILQTLTCIESAGIKYATFIGG